MILEYLLSKVMEPLWRRAEKEEEEQRGSGAGETLHIRAGTVTRFCQDYGLIDDLICFTAEVVLGGAPLSAGHTVSAIAVRDREAMRAGETLHIRAGTVTRFCQDYGLIDDLICFTAEVVLGGAPLSAGHTVSAIAVRDREAAGWRAVRVRYCQHAGQEGGESCTGEILSACRTGGRGELYG
ncbi:UNVERIFIED_CONTAM: hypothetical protein FKN15_020415 [Acipenser sinensis]